MMEAIRSTDTSVVTRTARRNMPEDGILQGHFRVLFRSYVDDWKMSRISAAEVILFDNVYHHSSLSGRWEE
jgi:hypothetical protein